MRYFENEDIIHINIKDGSEHSSVEMSPNITVELNKENEIIGIEILNATNFIRDGLLETIQGRILQGEKQ
jgi:uncharacterized protein YuzE